MHLRSAIRTGVSSFEPGHGWDALYATLTPGFPFWIWLGVSGKFGECFIPWISGPEGIVSKRKASPYRSGRSPDWLKMKNPACEAVRREAEEDWGR